MKDESWRKGAAFELIVFADLLLSRILLNCVKHVMTKQLQALQARLIGVQNEGKIPNFVKTKLLKAEAINLRFVGLC